MSFEHGDLNPSQLAKLMENLLVERPSDDPVLDAVQRQALIVAAEAKFSPEALVPHHQRRPSSLWSPSTLRPYGGAPTLITFRIIGDEKEHDTELCGLDKSTKVDELEFLSDTRRYHVVVTPGGVQSKIMVPWDTPGQTNKDTDIGWRAR